MKRWLSAMVAAVLCASCAPPSDSSESAGDATAQDDDLGIGAVLDVPDPEAETGPCSDVCESIVIVPVDPTKLGDPPLYEGPPDDNGYVVGAHLLTVTYAYMRTEPDGDAALVTGVDPGTGVHKDGIHLWGNPKGVLPPAQEVTLLDATPQHGYFHVKYDGKTGWISKKRLLLEDSDVDPVDFAMANANVFFKHQIHRTKWNKDGPSKSGSCAPASLAMAVRILGREPAGLSIEQSIHRIRHLYESPIDEASSTSGTTRAEIYKAATDDALDLSVHAMKTDHPKPSDALKALNVELDKKRLVILEGNTGTGAKVSTYQKEFNAIYAAAVKAGQSLYHTKYPFSGNHSILVVGRDEDGKYVVGDPMSEVGMVKLSGAAMKDFMSRIPGHRGTGNSVWVK